MLPKSAHPKIFFFLGIIVIVVSGLGFFIVTSNPGNDIVLKYNTSDIRFMDYDVTEMDNINGNLNLISHVTLFDNNGDNIVAGIISETANGSNNQPVNMLESMIYPSDNINSPCAEYNLTITPQGEMLNYISTTNIIPVIRFDYPFNIVFSEKPIKKGSTWTVPINEEKKYDVANRTVEYTMYGVRNYYCKGIEDVTVNNTSINCAIIDFNVSYEINMVISKDNNSIIHNASFESAGSTWSGINDGMIIKSDYNRKLSSVYNLTDAGSMWINIFGSINMKIPSEKNITIKLNTWG